MLKAACHIQKGLSASKFASKQEGPYVIQEIRDSGYFLLSRHLSMLTARSSLSLMYLKKYYEKSFIWFSHLVYSTINMFNLNIYTVFLDFARSLITFTTNFTN